MIRRAIYSPELHPMIDALAAERAQRSATLLDFRGLPQSARPLKIIVVGAGLAGLCSAYEFEQLGHEVVILEADPDHVGGRVRTLDFGDGLYGEAGAMRIPKYHALTRHYVSKFGLSIRKFVQSNDQAFYLVRGKRVRLSDEESLKARFNLSDQEKRMSLGDIWKQGVIKILEGLIQPEREDLDSTSFNTTTVRALDQRSLQQLFEASGLSEEAIDLITSAWGVETNLPTAAIENLREEMKAVWSSDFDELVGGTGKLPEAFTTRLKVKPRCGCEVIRIEQDASTCAVIAKYRDRGQIEQEVGDFVVCTVPLPVMPRIDIWPPISGAKRQAMRQVNYDSSTKVLAVCARRFWEQDDQIFGGGSSTDLPTAFTYYPSDNAEKRDPAVSASRSVLLASYSWGQPARRLGLLEDEQAHAVVKDSLETLHPQITGTNVIEQMKMWSWDHYKWTSGAFAWYLPGQHSALHHDLISPEGKIHFAGEHASFTHTWMQGALESARRVVQEILIAAQRSATSPPLRKSDT